MNFTRVVVIYVAKCGRLKIINKGVIIATFGCMHNIFDYLYITYSGERFRQITLPRGHVGKHGKISRVKTHLFLFISFNFTTK